MIVADPSTPEQLRDRAANLSHRLDLALSQRDRAVAALRQAIEDLEVCASEVPGTVRALEIERNVRHYHDALRDES